MSLKPLTDLIVRYLQDLWIVRKSCIVVMVPLILSPLPLLINDAPANCAYVVLIMGIYWVSEALPLAITSMLPAVLFPFLGVLDSGKVSMQYLKDINMLFIGGLAVAMAVENANLHKRIALKVLTIVGSSPSRLMFGFLCTTTFLSMWISNTASAAMMLPIAEAVIQELTKHYSNQAKEAASLAANDGQSSSKVSDPDSISEIPGSSNAGSIEGDQTDVKYEMSESEKNLSKAILLCVTYGSSIGGTGTLTGTGPNMILMGKSTEIPGGEGLNFTSWFMFSFPGMLVITFLSWIWLQILFSGWRKLGDFWRKTKTPLEAEIDRVLLIKYNNLGPMKFFEKIVLVNFIFLILLWFIRDPQFAGQNKGLAAVLKKRYVSDSTCALLVMILLFVLPRNKPTVLFFRDSTDGKEPVPQEPILKWSDMTRFPWGIILLLGGGFAMAEGVTKSGLGEWIGSKLVGAKNLPEFLIILLCTTLVSAVTEVTSNTATISMFLPILEVLATYAGLSPLKLMLPATIASSYAYMLPVGTPPNAIVFATGRLEIMDMVKCGVGMNIICILVVTISTTTYAGYIFDLTD